MLAKDNKIKTNSEFDSIKKNGIVYQSENFGIIVLDRKDSAKPRFGFIVSTKVDKMSIHRNRVKRALSEGVRFSLGLVPPGLDMIFLAKKSIVNKTTEEIMKEVETFLRQIPEK